MTKYFSTTGEILNTTLDKIVYIFEQDDINWNLRYKNASTLFIKLDDKVDGIIYTHKNKGEANDYFIKVHVMYTKAHPTLQLLSNIGDTLKKNGLIYCFEVYAQNSEKEEEYEIKHADWDQTM